MFLGTYHHRLLGGGQVALPSKIRSVLKNGKAILSTGFGDKCIYGYSIEDWEKIAEQELTSKPLSTTEGQRVRRQLFGAAEEIKTDGQGRFVVPPNLRTHAGIKDEIAVIGAGDHFELWDRAEWDKLK